MPHFGVQPMLCGCCWCRQLTLCGWCWCRTGNKSQAQVVRLGVRLIQAMDLSLSSYGQIVDPFATVKCEKAKFVTKAMAKVNLIPRRWIRWPAPWQCICRLAWRD